ncbi:hypothetical protein LTR78_001404 [Recurvomyces mirabilis]|uniref:Pre-mRNA-splicing factor SPF27 n=1 Tax=Recurvomyces mirabilis TaxID=574656 RepID=A0AAE0WWS1_9PEZI|nr:hypothetical protein LTR78_001404 [Recurvomyces mirabilis]KAK5161381.1 hypothetical protein LTS14_001177 [Recurvomyces mirabilis]
MPLLQPQLTSALPYVDAQHSTEAMSAAQALIEAEMDNTSTLHPSIPAMRESKASDLTKHEVARIGSGVAKDENTGIDMARYDAPEAPPSGSDKEAWNTALRQAYTSAEYLRGREINLSLLETYGKNAWLVCNSQLEDELRSLERDLEGRKLEVEEVEQARRAVQANAAGEVQSLEESWRKGVGRMIEVQAAAEGLRQEVLQRQRKGAK